MQAWRGSEGTGQSLGGCARPRIPGPGVLEVEAQAKALLPRLYLLHLPPRIPAPPPFADFKRTPATRRPTFISPHSRHCLRAFTDMLIPGPRERWPGRPAEGTEG